MIASDRTQLVERMKSIGKYKSFYLSLFPESSDDEEDQIYQIYGKLSSMLPMSITKLARSSSGITIEEI